MNERNFDKYLALYDKGVSIHDINPIDDQTYRVLVSSNVDIRVIDRDAHLSLITSLSHLRNFSKDTANYSGRFFYAIPVQTVKGTIVGFIFRSVFGKNYSTVDREFTDKNHKVPLMFGFYKDFEDFDDYDTCKPIIVCEGLKDCITLKKIYPYVLANNTSSMGINLQVLSNITDKFILIYDNDTAGQNGMDADVRNISKKKCSSIIIRPKPCYKDSADCFENKKDFEEFSNEIREKIRKFESGYVCSISRNLVRR